MGTKQIKTEDSIILDHLLYDTFKNTELEFPIKEVTKMKIRFKDSTSYFNNQFDYLIFFNNYIFHEGLNVLYDNYIAKIEKYSKQITKKTFRVLIDFDDESESLADGCDIDFEPLFTVVCEKLEIDSIVYFSLINCNSEYLSLFFEQLYETIYTYKTNRKFDPMFFLLPNTDYLIKNECAVTYLANKSNYIYDELMTYQNQKFQFKTKYNQIVFNSLYFNQFVKINDNYPTHETCSSSSSSCCNANDIMFDFIIKNSKYISFAKSVLYIDFKGELCTFLLQCDRLLLILNLMINATKFNQFFFSVQKDFNIETSQNFEVLIKKMISNQEKCSQKKSFQYIKILTINKKVDAITTENKAKNIDEENNDIKEFDEDKKSNKEGKEKEKADCIIHSLKNSDKTFKLRNIQNLIQSLIQDSYAYGKKDPKKLRKVLIEYNEVSIKEEPSVNENGLNESSENLMHNKKRIYEYHKETLSFIWFLSNAHIKTLQIAYLLSFQRKTTSKIPQEIHKKIFSMWFNKDYYINTSSLSTGIMKQSEFEIDYYM